MNLKGALARPGAAEGRARISAHRGVISGGIWLLALGFVATAALLRDGQLIAALGEAHRDVRSAQNSAPSCGSRPSSTR
jgi:hypothetical protein